ncbi:MAG: YraN family protein [Gemmatimonadetes bacterium]|nr:YraN family protein [Gemmatimonadota bacterium]
MDRAKIGRRGEERAARYLIDQGFRVIERNVGARVGEIDLVAVDEDDTLVFVEVRYRRSESYGSPGETVTWQKRRKLNRIALLYLKRKGWSDRVCRWDVIGISGETGRVVHLRNAFDGDGNIR